MSKNSGKRKKKWPWLLVILAAIAVFVFFQMRGSLRPGFKETAAARRDIATYYTFSGNLTPVTDEIQQAKEALKVKEVYVLEGDAVLEGDPLLRAIDGTRVFARASGTVETLFAEMDDALQPGAQIARIVDYGQLEVTVDVDEYDISAVKLGKKGEVFINALDRLVQGTVRDIARDATTTGGVSFYEVKLEISGENNIRSGMSAEVKVLKESATDAIALSLDAISFDEDNSPYVLVRGDDEAMARRYIQTGVSDGVFVQVVSGLSENELVYYADTDMLRFFGPSRMMGQGGN